MDDQRDVAISRLKREEECISIDGLNALLFVMHFISPSFTKKIILKVGEKSTMTQNPNFKYEDWGLTFASTKFLKAAGHSMWMSLGQDAFVGLEAPDTPVVTMDGSKTSICTYLKDGWAFTNNFDINQHQNLQDRLSAAQILVQKEPLCPVVVDDMSDVSAIKYGALPERLYGGLGPWGYDPMEVRSFLEKME
ncbi:Type I iodothyronine deiodinase [Liparis tanakae]|uniref:Iodothyronine deiodinase n=1 Tax=Liparis tanakae TaxID=230148 RepID=A0A4Z2HU64_9TELE|nr:Type I iodothyronine deiodinase [Liparis tanakae]